MGKTFSGEDFLKAFVVGCEVGPRVGLALHGTDLLSRGWHSGAVQGLSASAAAVSSLLDLLLEIHRVCPIRLDGEKNATRLSGQKRIVCCPVSQRRMYRFQEV